MGLWLDWCSHEATKRAVEEWHYTRRMPSGTTERLGVWEDGRFIGVVLFGTDASLNIRHCFGISKDQVRQGERIM